jgi:Flp pilus assembly pilin Flp
MNTHRGTKIDHQDIIGAQTAGMDAVALDVEPVSSANASNADASKELGILHTAHRKHPGKRQRGATIVEYSVLIALISVALIATINLFSGAIIRAFNAVIAVLPA